MFWGWVTGGEAQRNGVEVDLSQDCCLVVGRLGGFGLPDWDH